MKLLLKAIIDLVGNIRKLQVENNMNKNGKPGGHRHRKSARSILILSPCSSAKIDSGLNPEPETTVSWGETFLLNWELPSLHFFTEKEGRREEGRKGGREGKKEEAKVCYCLFSFFIIFFTWLIQNPSVK